MTSFSNSIHLGEKTTVKGKFCNCSEYGSTSIGLTFSDPPKGSDDIVIWGTLDQLQTIVDELGAALDGARAELDRWQGLAEAREEASNVATTA